MLLASCPYSTMTVSNSSFCHGNVARPVKTDREQRYHPWCCVHNATDEIVRDTSMTGVLFESFQHWESRTCIRFIDVNGTYDSPVNVDGPRIVKFIRGSV